MLSRLHVICYYPNLLMTFVLFVITCNLMDHFANKTVFYFFVLIAQKTTMTWPPSTRSQMKTLSPPCRCTMHGLACKETQTAPPPSPTIGIGVMEHLSNTTGHKVSQTLMIPVLPSIGPAKGRLIGDTSYTFLKT